MRCLKVLVTLLALIVLAAPAFSSEFPLREKYPEVAPISIDDLAASYDSVIVVDVRSQMEFDVAHVSKAKHVPVSNQQFVQQLGKIRAKNAATKIAFYCNGHTCAKSYKAAVKAQDAGFGEIYCFDAGVFEWISSHPDKGTLLGQSPADPGKLIPKSDLKARMLDFEAFKAAAAKPNTVIIDARDPMQRAKDATLDQNRPVKLDNVRNIPMDRLVKLVKKGEFKEKNLLVFDAVGKQVRWLQYYLEESDYVSYAFMDKGVLGAAAAGGVK